MLMLRQPLRADFAREVRDAPGMARVAQGAAGNCEGGQFQPADRCGCVREGATGREEGEDRLAGTLLSGLAALNARNCALEGYKFIGWSDLAATTCF